MNYTEADAQARGEEIANMSPEQQGQLFDKAWRRYLKIVEDEGYERKSSGWPLSRRSIDI